MRLSRLAATPQPLGLYVLAAHRMETSGTVGGAPPSVVFAGRLGTGTGAPGEAGRRHPVPDGAHPELPRPRPDLRRPRAAPGRRDPGLGADGGAGRDRRGRRAGRRTARPAAGDSPPPVYPPAPLG
ncbi:DUF2330 domain-containing protein [Streptomyces sp. NPDC042638]|uniref:DUF2330 domain-containing protein n=1 Tax=Streptomyces sp. NPDC042638 TaxID=3154333 RepID=UPI0033E1A9A1